MEILFKGSKSEGIYPVLQTKEGRKFRLHYKDNDILDEKSFAQYASKSVSIIGVADNLRGHWRIVLKGEDLTKLIEVLPSPAPDDDERGD